MKSLASQKAPLSIPVNYVFKKASFWDQVKKHHPLYLILLPGLIYYIIFRYIPLYGILIAFKDLTPFDGLDAILTSPWVGLKQFDLFFHSYYFWNILNNTFILAGYRLLTEFFCPIILALLVNEIGQRHFKKAIQTISYLPHFISTVVLSGMVMTLLSTNGGFIPALVKHFGGEPLYYLADPRFFRGILVGSMLWKSVGWGTIVYLAAMAGVDPQLYEAAEMDGASKWQQMWNITLPSISYAVVIMFILKIGHVINEGFQETLLLYSPPVYQVGDIIDTYVYRIGLEQMKYSFATAVEVFKSILSLILILSSNYLAKKMGQEGLY
jgi:putative aldouronate transport system permease protein